MATYNAESALARWLATDHPCGDAARDLLDRAFRTRGDLDIIDKELHVRLEPPPPPGCIGAVAALGDDLTATRTLYPGTDLMLVYSMEEDNGVRLRRQLRTET